MCRSPSARQAMLVISENLFWRPVVQDRHRTPAPSDFGHILQQGSPAGLASTRRNRSSMARLVAVVMFSPVSCARFRAKRSVSGSLMLRAIVRFLGSCPKVLIPCPHAKAVSPLLAENNSRPIVVRPDLDGRPWGVGMGRESLVVRFQLTELSFLEQALVISCSATGSRSAQARTSGCEPRDSQT